MGDHDSGFTEINLRSQASLGVTLPKSQAFYIYKSILQNVSLHEERNGRIPPTREAR